MLPIVSAADGACFADAQRGPHERIPSAGPNPGFDSFRDRYRRSMPGIPRIGIACAIRRRFRALRLPSAASRSGSLCRAPGMWRFRRKVVANGLPPRTSIRISRRGTGQYCRTGPGQAAETPPVTLIVWPVTRAAAGLARNATIEAMSSGCTTPSIAWRSALRNSREANGSDITLPYSGVA